MAPDAGTWGPSPAAGLAAEGVASREDPCSFSYAIRASRFLENWPMIWSATFCMRPTPRPYCATAPDSSRSVVIRIFEPTALGWQRKSIDAMALPRPLASEPLALIFAVRAWSSTSSKRALHTNTRPTGPKRTDTLPLKVRSSIFSISSAPGMQGTMASTFISSGHASSGGRDTSKLLENCILLPLPVLNRATAREDLEDFHGCDGQGHDGSGHLQRVIDGCCDRRAHGIGAPFPGSLHAERVQRAGRIFGDHHVNLRHLVRRHHQVISEGGGKRLPHGVVGELLEQRPAQTLGQAADDLPFDHLWVDRPADVVGHEVALHVHAARAFVDLHLGDMDAIRIVHVVTVEPPFRRQARLMTPAGLLTGMQIVGDMPQRHAFAVRIVLAHD